MVMGRDKTGKQVSSKKGSGGGGITYKGAPNRAPLFTQGSPAYKSVKNTYGGYKKPNT